MGISFGPGGNSESFTNRKLKYPDDLLGYLEDFGLNGYEVECGRGVRISDSVRKTLTALSESKGIVISLHAPYYISLSSVNTETRLKSIDYIKESAAAARGVGAKKIVVHSGSCAKITREEALSLAKDTLILAQNALDEIGLDDIIICPETMGKINQLGTLDEVLELCSVDERFLPCIDFGHLNARTLGEIKAKADYEKILTEIEDKLGFDRLSNMHIHFSKIMYTAGGEKTHLTFEDTEFGPKFEPLIELIAKKKLTPSIICESNGTQAEDAATMKKYYDDIRKD